MKTACCYRMRVRRADRLGQLLGDVLPRERERASELWRGHAEATSRLDAIEGALAMTPDEDAVREATEAREAALVELGREQALLEQAVEVEEEAVRKVSHRTAELDRLLENDRVTRGEAAGRYPVRSSRGDGADSDRAVRSATPGAPP